MRRRRLLSMIAATPLLSGCMTSSSESTTGPPENTTSVPGSTRSPSEDTTETSISTTSQSEGTTTSQASTATPSEPSILDERDQPSRDSLPTESLPPAEEPANATEDTVTHLDYPTKPAEYTDTTMAEFVESHERAYFTNDKLATYGGSLVSTDVDVSWALTLDTDSNAGVGKCKYSHSGAVDDDDGYSEWSSHGYIVVTYYVDDSMIVRAEKRGEDQRRELDPNPWETGIILAPDE